MSAIVRTALPAVLCVWLLSGCSIGPSVIRCNMVRYNESVVGTENEQFLLNLVRIRYCEIPKTLGVSQVTTQYTLNQTAPLSGVLTHFAQIPKTTSALPLGSMAGGFTGQLVDVPTITFIPQSGGDFQRGLAIPLGLDRVVLMASTGWDLETLLRLTVQSLNRVENVPHLIGHRPVRYSTDFNEVVAAFGRLQHQNKLRLTMDPQPVLSAAVLAEAVENDKTAERRTREKKEERPMGDKKDEKWMGDKKEKASADKNKDVVDCVDKVEKSSEKMFEIKGADLLNAAEKRMRFVREADGKVKLRSTFEAYGLNINDDAFGDAELVRALNMLPVGPGKPDRFMTKTYRVMTADHVPLTPSENDIFVVTRNVIGCSVFASKGIEIPEAHYREGLIEPAVDEYGQPFDWTLATRGMFTVSTCKHRPKNAYVAVQHRGYWFYIADDDKPTKTTFALLKEMFDVQIAPGLSAAPILTISTSGSAP